MTTDQIIEEAIRTRKPVSGRYGGVRREFCPHALGWKGADRHVLVYQFGGGSESGLPRDGEWRCLRLDELDDVAIQQGPWRTGANVFNPQACIDDMDAVVEALAPLVRSRDRRG
jgi:hypothetical protein